MSSSVSFKQTKHLPKHFRLSNITTKMVYFTLIIFKSFIRIQISENSPVLAYNNKICQKYNITCLKHAKWCLQKIVKIRTSPKLTPFRP